jgi:hypothetical protein
MLEMSHVLCRFYQTIVLVEGDVSVLHACAAVFTASWNSYIKMKIVQMSYWFIPKNMLLMFMYWFSADVTVVC